MKPEIENQPFLGYSDDPAGQSDDGPSVDHPLERAKTAARNHRIGRDLLVFFIASLLWLGAIFTLLPWPSTAGPTGTSAKHGDSAPEGVIGDPRVHNLTSNSKWVSCGNSTAEARQNDCQYDPLLNHWVPSRCADQEWIDEYLDDDSWTAFADINLTQQLSPEDMGERDHYYTSIRDHVNHCAMLWRKQFWTLFEDRKVIDGVIVNTYHTEHCAQFMSDLMGMNRTKPTFVRVGFSGCWIRKTNEEL